MLINRWKFRCNYSDVRMQEATDAWLGQVAAQLQQGKISDHKKVLLSIRKICREKLGDEVFRIQPTTNFSCTPTLHTTHACMQYACPSDSPADSDAKFPSNALHKKPIVIDNT